jgi:hypothetical protein
MTEIAKASFDEVEGVKITFQVVKFAADKSLRFSKLRGALADCNTRLDECQDAYIWREARERNFYSALC